MASCISRAPEQDNKPLNPTRFQLLRHGQDHEQNIYQNMIWMAPPLILIGSCSPLGHLMNQASDGPHFSVLFSRPPQAWPIKLCLKYPKAFLAPSSKLFHCCPTNQFWRAKNYTVGLITAIAPLLNLFWYYFPGCYDKAPPKRNLLEEVYLGSQFEGTAHGSRGQLAILVNVCVEPAFSFLFIMRCKPWKCIPHIQGGSSSFN